MKKKTHPTYFPETKVVCNCGMTTTLGSTKESINVEVCFSCHPYYTGKQNIIDTAGRVERFQARMKKAEALKAAPSKEKKETTNTEKKEIKSLKDLKKEIEAKDK